MSTYENYTQVSSVYDETRWAVGLDLITEGLSSTCTAIEQQVLLDAGCGTGIYTAALIDRVSRIEAVDLNPAMLSVAQSKLVNSPDRDRVRFWRASISELPLDDNSVDSIVINQVLHHLSDRVENDWPAHRKVLAECTRVLKPHGVMIINSCAHVQLDRGFWFYHLIPAALAAVKQRTIPLDDL
ncbi:MAG: class I SAM-dependent methyltransferase, partial [Pseudomonadota bacterium]|nr:class I SAM-dependent methyltransferase [Pseudomonadota bacterium]